MKLAARAARVVPSPTLSITATAKAMVAQGIDVVDFASGEPDFDTPAPVKEAAEAAIRAGFTKYTPSSGIDELRTAVADKLKTEQGLHYDKSQILVSCGAKHSLYNLAEALLEAGDEVIIPTPFWVSYQDQVLLNDATPVLLPTREENGYTIEESELEARVTKKTKAIIVNAPCNPTGTTYNRRTLEGIAAVALRHDLIIVSDEIYEKVLYDGLRHVSIAALGPDVAARTVVINGVSKAFAMTGWRIGYAAGPKDLITAMGNIQSQSTSNPCSISQKAAVAALRLGDSFTMDMVREFDRRRARHRSATLRGSRLRRGARNRGRRKHSTRGFFLRRGQRRHGERAHARDDRKARPRRTRWARTSECGRRESAQDAARLRR